MRYDLTGKLKSFLLVLLLGAVVLQLWSCSSDNSKPLNITIPDSLNIDDKALAAKTIPKILKECPGLRKYGNELEYKGISYNPQDAKGISVAFYVPEESKVPSRYRANGHSCEIYVDQAASTLRIQKSECAAVCLDQEIAGTPLDPKGSDITIALE